MPVPSEQGEAGDLACLSPPVTLPGRPWPAAQRPASPPAEPGCVHARRGSSGSVLAVRSADLKARWLGSNVCNHRVCPKRLGGVGGVRGVGACPGLQLVCAKVLQRRRWLLLRLLLCSKSALWISAIPKAGMGSRFGDRFLICYGVINSSPFRARNIRISHANPAQVG